MHIKKPEWTYPFSMEQSAAHGLEVFAAKLTHYVWWVSCRSIVGSALKPRRHAVDFVLDQVRPVFAVDIAFLAVEVSWVVELVTFHLLLRVEGLIAAVDVALDCPDRLEWCNHLGGVWMFRGGTGWGMETVACSLYALLPGA
jgi:hypothetical protein